MVNKKELIEKIRAEIYYWEGGAFAQLPGVKFHLSPEKEKEVNSLREELAELLKS